jgi:hypothetical protein
MPKMKLAKFLLASDGFLGDLEGFLNPYAEISSIDPAAP